MIRTCGLMVPNHALYQLSHTWIYRSPGFVRHSLVQAPGAEWNCLGRKTQKAKLAALAGVAGFEPAHTGVKVLCLTLPLGDTPLWYSTSGSNRYFTEFESVASANWASGALSWPYYYYPILACLVSNPIHRAMENIATLSQ